MRNRVSLMTLLFFPLALAACNGQSNGIGETPTDEFAALDQEPIMAAVVEADGGSGEGTLSTQAISRGGSLQNFTADVNFSSTMTSSMPNFKPMSFNSPAGLKASYQFNGDDMKTRVDIPAEMFEDGRARIVTYNTATDRAKVLFANTLQPDTSISSTELEELLGPALKGPGGVAMNIKSFYTQPLSEFAAQNGLSAQSLTQQGGLYASPTLSKSLGDVGEATLKRYYDPNTKLVTKYDATLNGTHSIIRGTTQVSYTPVANIAGANIPTRVVTTQSVTPKNTGGTMQLKITTNLTNVKVNTLSSSYFNVGGYE